MAENFEIVSVNINLTYQLRKIVSAGGIKNETQLAFLKIWQLSCAGLLVK